MNNLMVKQNIQDIVDEYAFKLENLPDELTKLRAQVTFVNTFMSMKGTFVKSGITTNHFSDEQAAVNLTASSWQYVYDILNIKYVATAKERKAFHSFVEKPTDFTVDNIIEMFGEYADVRTSLLRRIADIFSQLDHAYKSHNKVKMGTKGLPKRIIINNLNVGWGRGYGAEHLSDMINVLNILNNKPEIDWEDMERLTKVGTHEYEPCGLTIKVYLNGNAHVHFTKDQMDMINRLIAEYYGDVLPDTGDVDPDTPKSNSKALSKDLQFYPTPKKVAETMIDRGDFTPDKIKNALEPSCGEGSIMEMMVGSGIPRKNIIGVEIDSGRVMTSRSKGFSVIQTNFLDYEPVEKHDLILMNPPFYGRHYQAHVKKAIDVLDDDGYLSCVLPATAMYDHGFVEDMQKKYYHVAWRDLPVGSFSSSGTNVPTGILTIKTKKESR